MRQPFRSARTGIQVNLDQQECQILAQLLGQLDDLLDDGAADDVDPLAAMIGMSDRPGAAPTTPDDPALARLLPDGNRDDPDASAEYRRLTEYGLRARKRSGARLAAGALRRTEPVVLTDDEALALLKALTDVRLVLGQRLELHTDEDAELLHQRLWAEAGDPAWLAGASIYELLTSWQEYLVAAVARRR